MPRSLLFEDPELFELLLFLALLGQIEDEAATPGMPFCEAKQRRCPFAPACGTASEGPRRSPIFTGDRGVEFAELYVVVG